MKLVDEDRYCIDVLTQITAIQAALDKVAPRPRAPLGHEAEAGDKDSMTEELMAAVARLMRRG